MKKRQMTDLNKMEIRNEIEQRNTQKSIDKANELIKSKNEISSDLFTKMIIANQEKKEAIIKDKA